MKSEHPDIKNCWGIAWNWQDTQNWKYCDKHNRFYENSCPRCEKEMNKMAKDVCIERLDVKIEGAKRQQVPYAFNWTCSVCGARHKDNYAETYYLTHPKIPGEVEIGLWCEDCGEEQGNLILAINLVLTSVSLEDK